MPVRQAHARVVASGRRRSEDRAEVFDRDDGLVVVVADGAGGMAGGALASDALVETARAVARNPTLDLHDAALWTALFEEVDAALAVKMAGETTGVVVAIGPGGLTGASVGDSEAWVVTTTSIDDLTRNQNRRRLGSGRATPVPFARTSREGVLVVATDGLFKYSRPERIAEVVRASAFEHTAERLVELVRLRTGDFQDDVGVVVVACAT
jgi:serine/threonine protein phosphatase PrpC